MKQQNTQRATGPLELTLSEYRAMTKPTRQRSDAEFDMQCALIEWRDRLLPQYPVLRALVHIPQGEYRTPKAAARIKALGGDKGLPDLLFCEPQAGQQNGIAWFRPGMCIECKVDKNELTPDQKRWKAILEACHYAYYVVHDDWTIAARLIAAWCGLPEELVP